MRGCINLSIKGEIHCSCYRIRAEIFHVETIKYPVPLPYFFSYCRAQRTSGIPPKYIIDSKRE